MELDLSAIGMRIQERRNFLKLTQQEIYDKVDISHNHYSRIENGHAAPSLELLVNICEILDISIDYIITGNISTNKNPNFVDKFNKLTTKQKQYIISQIDTIKEFNLK